MKMQTNEHGEAVCTCDHLALVSVSQKLIANELRLSYIQESQGNFSEPRKASPADGKATFFNRVAEEMARNREITMINVFFKQSDCIEMDSCFT